MQEIEAVTQVVQQGQLELAQRLLRRAVFRRQRLQALQIIEEQHRVVGFLLEHARQQFVHVQAAVQHHAAEG